MQKRTTHKNKLFQFLCSHIAKNPSLKCTYFFTQSSNTNTLLHTPLSPTQYGPIFYQDVKDYMCGQATCQFFWQNPSPQDFWSWVKGLVEFPLLNGREGKYFMRNKETWNYAPSTRLFLTSKKRVQGIIVLWYRYCTSGVVIRIPWFSPLTRSTTLGLQAEHGDHYR